MKPYLAYDAEKLQKIKRKRIIQCNKCNSRSIIAINTNGLKQNVCAFCFMKGEFVIV
jgi:DNA-directed RNA polymerase subunit RPC12/RpoP